MKKKKYTFIYKTILLSIFLGISLIAQHVHAEDPWYFIDGANTMQGPYGTKFECLNAESKSSLGLLIKECYQQPPIPFAPITPTPGYQSVDAQKANDINDTYTLLAPIGSLTEIKSSGGTCPNNPDVPNGIGCYLNIIFLIAIGLCGALAVIMIVIGGIQYMGTESVFGKTEAKGKIVSAILGLLIALGAYALLKTIDPALTGQNGVTVDQVTADIEEETVPWSEYQKGDNIKDCPSGFTDIDIKTGASPAKINVCKSIAGNLTNLINAAYKDHIILISGSGSRSTARQQELRVQHGCPDPTSPSSVCSPKTARPGHSNHERGLAIDFKYCSSNGVRKDFTKTDTANPCYIWLTKNAGNFGFKNNYNLLKETWHWSTTGT